MRAREILQEDYSLSLESDLNNILIGAKGAGASEINTQDVVSQLHGMGYSVDVNSIMTLLSNNPAISNATPEQITLAPPEGATMGPDDNQEDSAAQVSALAQTAAQKGLK